MGRKTNEAAARDAPAIGQERNAPCSDIAPIFAPNFVALSTGKTAEIPEKRRGLSPNIGEGG
jgi:hypothetical protein